MSTTVSLPKRRRLWRPGERELDIVFTQFVPIQWEQWSIASLEVNRGVGQTASVGAHPDLQRGFAEFPEATLRIICWNAEGLLLTLEQIGQPQLLLMRAAGQQALAQSDQIVGESDLPAELVERFSRIIHAFWLVNHELNLIGNFEKKPRDTRYIWGTGGDAEVADRKLLAAMARSHCVTLARLPDEHFDILKALAAAEA